MHKAFVFSETPPDKSRVLAPEICDRSAWYGRELQMDDWLLPLPPSCTVEIDDVARVLKYDPRLVDELQPTQFDLSHCRESMAQVGELLRHGVGFAVLDRVPVERYSVSESRAIAWLLVNLLGPVVAQKFSGKNIYDVHDTGTALGYGVRRSLTNFEQEFHTDGPWVRHSPWVVGLFCQQSAREGGISRMVSLSTVHNELRRQHPIHLERLYEPFWWDRQAEHPPNQMKAASHPVYRYDGTTLIARYYEDYIINGYKLIGSPLDAPGVEALAAMRGIVEKEGVGAEFRLRAGQFLFVNNRLLAHGRSKFTDGSQSKRKRHLLRFWVRGEGRPDIDG